MKYSPALRALHWLMAIIILSLIAVGFYMANLSDNAANKYDLYPIHKAFGFIILMLVFVRVATRLKSTIPAPLSGLAQWEHTLSHAIHMLLYVSMFTMALSGYFMSATYGSNISMFGLFEVPMIVGENEFWGGITHEIHEITAWVFSGSLVLHIAGVIKHRFMDAPENDVLKRMM